MAPSLNIAGICIGKLSEPFGDWSQYLIRVADPAKTKCRNWTYTLFSSMAMKIGILSSEFSSLLRTHSQVAHNSRRSHLKLRV